MRLRSKIERNFVYFFRTADDPSQFRICAAQFFPTGDNRRIRHILKSRLIPAVQECAVKDADIVVSFDIVKAPQDRLFRVSVPVLSVHRMSSAPRFWTAFRFLMMTFFLRHRLRTLRKTGGDEHRQHDRCKPHGDRYREESRAEPVALCCSFTTKTTGTITSIKRIRTFRISSSPLLKLCLDGTGRQGTGGLSENSLIADCRHDALALPLTTLLPMNTRYRAVGKPVSWGRQTRSFAQVRFRRSARTG